MAAAFRPRFRRSSTDETVEGDGVAGAGDELGEGAGNDPGGEADDDHDEWLAYELHGWALESRVMLQQLLTVDEVVHSWQGTTLLVHESLEAKVDSLVDEVEETEEAKEATARPIGPDDDLTAFEIGDWSPELRAELVERLVQASVPHIVEESGSEDEDDDDEHAGGEDVDGEARGGEARGEEHAGGEDVDGEARGGEARGEDVDGDVGESQGGGCDLWVREVDEERVDLVIDDLLAQVEEADLAELDGLEVNDLLSRLFVACDRLRRDPRDLEGVRGVLVNARQVAGVRTPFGFSAPNWRALRNAAAELLALVEGDDTDEDDLREHAHRLSDALRMII